MKNFLLFCLTIYSFSILQAQSAGDIAFIAFNGDEDDDFAIVALNPIAANTVIYFTDNNPTEGGGIGGGEGYIQWNSGAASIPVGTVIVFTDAGSSSALNASVGTLTNGSGDFNLNSTGDALFAYTGTDESSPTTFLAGVQSDADQEGNFLADTGLTEGTTFVTFSLVDRDGGVYIGARDTESSFSDYLALIGDASNWSTETSNGENILPIDVSAFSITAMPVSLTHFIVLEDNKYCALKWQTSQELNNSHFEIQHSTDGRTFQQIGEEKGAGNSDTTIDYAFSHTSPANGINYYRLKQLDYDGRYEYSEIVSLRFEKETSISVHPNPVKADLTVTLNKEFADNATAEIISQSGRTLSVQTFTEKSFTQTINVNTLPKGVYILRIVNGNDVHIERFVKK